jgi:hypothetical protein
MRDFNMAVSSVGSIQGRATPRDRDIAGAIFFAGGHL